MSVVWLISWATHSPLSLWHWFSYFWRKKHILFRAVSVSCLVCHVQKKIWLEEKSIFIAAIVVSLYLNWIRICLLLFFWGHLQLARATHHSTAMIIIIIIIIIIILGVWTKVSITASGYLIFHTKPIELYQWLSTVYLRHIWRILALSRRTVHSVKRVFIRIFLSSSINLVPCFIFISDLLSVFRILIFVFLFLFHYTSIFVFRILSFFAVLACARVCVCPSGEFFTFSVERYVTPELLGWPSFSLPITASFSVCCIAWSLHLINLI